AVEHSCIVLDHKIVHSLGARADHYPQVQIVPVCVPVPLPEIWIIFKNSYCNKVDSRARARARTRARFGLVGNDQELEFRLKLHLIYRFIMQQLTFTPDVLSSPPPPIRETENAMVKYFSLNDKP